MYGRYSKSNLQRHIRSFHLAVKSMIGCVCRQCGQECGRADARRKHEYEQHGFLDVKPKKRRNASAAGVLLGSGTLSGS